MITTKPVWLTVDCTRCEGATIVLIKQSRLAYPGFANWTCPHCGNLQEFPIVGEVVFFDRDLGMRGPADVSQGIVDRPHTVEVQ